MKCNRNNVLYLFDFHQVVVFVVLAILLDAMPSFNLIYSLQWWGGEMTQETIIYYNALISMCNIKLIEKFL